MHFRYEGLVSDEISAKIKSCELVDEWLEEVVGDIGYNEKMTSCIANILNVYGEQFMMEICYVTQVLFKMSLSDLQTMARDLGVFIQPKMLKRKFPAEGVINRILSQYSKPRVAHRLKSFASDSMIDLFPVIANKEMPPQERLDAFMERMSSMYKPIDDQEKLDYRRHMITFTASSGAWITNDEDWYKFILDQFDEQHWELYEVSIFSAYRSVFYTKARSHKLNMESLLTEKKELEGKYNSQIKQHKQLSKQLDQTTQEKDKLRGQISQLNDNAESQLEEATTEIGHLQKYIEEMELEKDEEIGSLKNEIIHLKSQLTGKSDRPLEGLTVCVVGIPQDEQFFEQTIIKYGGKFEFFPSVLDSTNPRLMSGPINRSDIVLYCHSYSSHTVRDLLKGIAADKTEYLESNGKSSFENLLLTRIIPNLRQTTLVR